MSWRGPAGIVLLALAAGVAALTAQRLLAPPPPASAAEAALQAIDERGLRTGSLRIDLELPDPDGTPQRLSQWDGRRVLLNFWATWCPPCREEMPRLRAAQAVIGEEHAQIVGIAVDQPEDVRAWLAENPSNYPILIDDFATHPATSLYGNPRAILPYSVLIDASGRIERRKFGVLSEADLEIWLRPPSR